MEAPKHEPVPLAPHQAALLDQLVAKLTGWGELLGMGQAGATRLRVIIRQELATYQAQTALGKREAALLAHVVEKLTRWDKLLGIGKPGAKQLQAIIATELEGYQTQLIRGHL